MTMAQLWEWIEVLIDRGGPIMIVLLALSVVSLALIVERSWFWLRNRQMARSGRLAKLNDALRRSDRAALDKLMKHCRTPYDHVARAMLRHGATDAVAIEAVQEQRPQFERFMVMLSTIITAAPLLGILGTVMGIIQSFNLLGEQAATGDPRAISVGIAQALLTTAMGLVIALMTLFPYMIFRGQVDRALGRLESLIAAAQQGQQTDHAKNHMTSPSSRDASKHTIVVDDAGDAGSPSDTQSLMPAGNAGKK